jgi:hypothetical protein
MTEARLDDVNCTVYNTPTAKAGRQPTHNTPSKQKRFVSKFEIQVLVSFPRFRYKQHAESNFLTGC